MRKIFLLLLLMPFSAFASPSGMSASNTLSSSMIILAGIQIVVTPMIFPTQVAGTTPANVDTTQYSAVQGGQDGAGGNLTVTSPIGSTFALSICQIGSTGCIGTPGNNGTGGSGRLNNGVTYYDVAYSGPAGPADWTHIYSASGSVPIKIKGAISATGNAFTAGVYVGSALCTVTYL